MPIDLFPDLEAMPEDQIRAMFSEVARRMPEDIASSMSEIYFPKSADSELLENGTGAFVRINGKRFLVSNAHVLDNDGILFGIGDGFEEAQADSFLNDAPLDLAAYRVRDQVWAAHEDVATAVPFERFAATHETAFPIEILWIAGYPGARVKQLSGFPHAVCQTLPTQAHQFLDGEVPHKLFDPRFHLAVGYNPNEALLIDGADSWSSPGLSNPPGLSGSLLWNTKRLECHYAGTQWSPSQAEVIGIVWGWPSSNYLIATKVEALRKFMIHVSARED
jgi:hypothetical protein